MEDKREICRKLCELLKLTRAGEGLVSIDYEKDGEEEYAKVYWQNDWQKDHPGYKGEKCKTAAVTVEEIKAAFISAFNQLVAGKKEIITNAELMRRTFCATEALQEEKFRLASEMSVLSGMMQKLVEANARVAQNQEEYTKQYNDLVRQYDEAKAMFNEVVDTITAKGKQKARLGAFISALKKQEGIIDEFTPDLWGSMVDFITVGRKKEIKVTFRDGTEIMA